MSGGVERAAAGGSFGDDNGVGEPADEAITLEKAPFADGFAVATLPLGDDRAALLHDALGETLVGAW